MAKYSYPMLLSLVICLDTMEGSAQTAQTTAPIRTDKAVYKVIYTSKRAKIKQVKITIKTLYTNQTGTIVYLEPGCGAPISLMLEKKVGEQWIAAYNLPVALCGLIPCGEISPIPKNCAPSQGYQYPFYPIGPRKTYADLFNIELFPPDSDKEPKFSPKIKEMTGTYRLVRRIYNDRGLLPMEERSSNEFKIVESRPQQKPHN